MSINYRLTVAGVMQYRDHVLVGKKARKDDQLNMHWNIPRGKVDSEEQPEDALVREIREEAGIAVKVVRYLDEYLDNESRFRALWYLCDRSRMVWLQVMILMRSSMFP